MSASHGTQNFTKEQEELWTACNNALAALNAHLDRTLRAHAEIKLTDFLILSALVGSRKGAPTAVRMGELAQKTNVSPSRLTYQIEVLLRHKWVRKEPVESDRRGKGIIITDTGLSVYEKAHRIYAHEVREIALTEIEDSSWAHFTDFFNNILERISHKPEV